MKFVLNMNLLLRCRILIGLRLILRTLKCRLWFWVRGTIWRMFRRLLVVRLLWNCSRSARILFFSVLMTRKCLPNLVVRKVTRTFRMRCRVRLVRPRRTLIRRRPRFRLTVNMMNALLRRLLVLALVVLMWLTLYRRRRVRIRVIVSAMVLRLRLRIFFMLKRWVLSLLFLRRTFFTSMVDRLRRVVFIARRVLFCLIIRVVVRLVLLLRKRRCRLRLLTILIPWTWILVRIFIVFLVLVVRVRILCIWLRVLFIPLLVLRRLRRTSACRPRIAFLLRLRLSFDRLRRVMRRRLRRRRSLLVILRLVGVTRRVFMRRIFIRRLRTRVLVMKLVRFRLRLMVILMCLLRLVLVGVTNSVVLLKLRSKQYHGIDSIG